VPEFRPNFTATGIGTLPHPEAEAAVDDVLARLAEMPYWPQLPQRDPCEDMGPQYAPALAPLVASRPGSRPVEAYGEMSREEALAAFYERLLTGPPESFGLTPDHAAGFFAFVDAVGQAPASAFPWLKGHVTGPITLGLAVPGDDGKALLYDDEVAEALAQGLGAAAAAQVEQMAHLGRPAMIFFDEPGLSGFGSAFTPIARERVLELLGAAFSAARERAEMVIGVHCCGNTDWSLLVEAGADVLNLDSAAYGEHLLLYPEAVGELLDRGGAVAWGAVPTSEYTGTETAEELWAVLKGLLTTLEEKGLDRSVLASQALVTPACGMGGLSVEAARAILDLTAGVSALARAEYA
jgi:methionine synthase II (cobalamin-independent)